MNEPLYLTMLELDAVFCHNHHITDAYSIHRIVYSMLPKAAAPGRILYVDRGVVKGMRKVLILSQIMPEIPKDISASVRKIGAKFFNATKYRFEIILNPVKCNPENKKRQAVTGQLPLLNYFTERMNKWGFEADLNYLEVIPLPSLKFECRNNQYRFNQAKFRGVLNVTDVELFRKTFSSGIGHGKAFGFGLLQLDPIQ